MLSAGSRDLVDLVLFAYAYIWEIIDLLNCWLRKKTQPYVRLRCAATVMDLTWFCFSLEDPKNLKIQKKKHVKYCEKRGPCQNKLLWRHEGEKNKRIGHDRQTCVVLFIVVHLMVYRLCAWANSIVVEIIRKWAGDFYRKRPSHHWYSHFSS